MTWSLEITNGDISYGQNGLNTVTGSDKLVQDLSCCILEPLGTDFNDPDYGSIIEGGIDSDGNVYLGLIGSINDTNTSTMIQSEIQRICQNYQAQQVQRNQNDLSTYGSSTLSAGEALLNVSNIQVQQVENMAYVTATLNTGNGTAQLATGLGN
jgi:hypothetical protein